MQSKYLNFQEKSQPSQAYQMCNLFNTDILKSIDFNIKIIGFTEPSSKLLCEQKC